MSTTPETKNAPVHKERSGSVEAAIWENQVGSEEKTRLGITLTKSYKDPKGNWQRTTTLDPKDLPRAVEVLERANAWVVGQRQAIAQVTDSGEEHLDHGQQEQRQGRTVTRGR